MLACAGVAGYLLVDRWQQHRRRPVVNDPLKDCVTHSLQEVNHQIKLLKNVLWWHLLPLDVGLAAYILIPSARSWHKGFDAFFVTGFVVGFCALVSWVLHRVNQHAVRKELESRRRELAALLAGLEGNASPEAKP